MKAKEEKSFNLSIDKVSFNTKLETHKTSSKNKRSSKSINLILILLCNLHKRSTNY